MNGLNRKQKEMAVLLLHEPKTFEELLKENGFGYSQLKEEIRGLLKKKVIEKRGGFPTRYYLKREHWKDAMELEEKLGFSE